VLGLKVQNLPEVSGIAKLVLFLFCTSERIAVCPAASFTPETIGRISKNMVKVKKDKFNPVTGRRGP
jgi:hypothetical protein